MRGAGQAPSSFARRLIRPERTPLIEWIFIRALALIYFASFASFVPQMVPLLGANGIVPAARLLAALQADLGWRAYGRVPTVFWLSATDAALWGACVAGCVFAVLLFAGVGWRFWAGFCFVLYLSIANVGQPFTLYQWDGLLLESGFLAIFAGTEWTPWAFRLLVFRLMFESGFVKLASGDPNWRNLHALRFHFFTQPLPNPAAWYASQAPAWLLDALTLTTLVMELVVPFALYAPKRVRRWGALLLIALQVNILLTGNYAFFNWLTIALCLWGLADGQFEWLRLPMPSVPDLAPSARPLQWICRVVTVVMLLLGSMQLLNQVAPAELSAGEPLLAALGPYQVVNSYGLFAVMTTTRPEIIVEGSNDGNHWQEYSFRFKPGAPGGPLPAVAPYQPRLDWQMWFAALSSAQQEAWFQNLILRLLQGDRGVLGLLERSPFPAPPQFMRASLYDYRFTSWEQRRQTGAVWERRYLRPYLPAVTLRR